MLSQLSYAPTGFPASAALAATFGIISHSGLFVNRKGLNSQEFFCFRPHTARGRGAGQRKSWRPFRSTNRSSERPSASARRTSVSRSTRCSPRSIRPCPAWQMSDPLSPQFYPAPVPRRGSAESHHIFHHFSRPPDVGTGNVPGRSAPLGRLGRHLSGVGSRLLVRRKRDGSCVDASWRAGSSPGGIGGCRRGRFPGVVGPKRSTRMVFLEK